MTDFRIAIGFTTHHKTRRIERLGGRDACWSLLCLLEYCAAHRPSGDLAAMTDEDIAIAAQWQGDAKLFVQWLVEAGYLDGEPGAYRVHDYAAHQPYVATGPARSAAARAAAMIRWHRAGHHGESVEGCPLCMQNANADLHLHDASHDANRMHNNVTKPDRHARKCKSDANRMHIDAQIYKGDANRMQTGLHRAPRHASPERIALRRGAAQTRWHRAGKHVDPVEGCPLCMQNANACEPMHDAVHDAHSMQTRCKRDASAMQTRCKCDANVHDASFQANSIEPLPKRVSEIDASHDAGALRSHANRNAPYPDPFKNDHMSEVAQIAASRSAPPSALSFASASDLVPDAATAAKLSDVAHAEWGWRPLTPAQTSKALRLAPFSASELAAAKRIVDERDAGRLTRNKLGLLLAIVESSRNGGSAPTKPPNGGAPKPQAHSWREKLYDKDEAFLRAHVAWCRMHERSGDAERAREELQRVRDEWLTRKGQERADEILA